MEKCLRSASSQQPKVQSARGTLGGGRGYRYAAKEMKPAEAIVTFEKTLAEMGVDAIWGRATLTDY